MRTGNHLCLFFQSLPVPPSTSKLLPTTWAAIVILISSGDGQPVVDKEIIKSGVLAGSMLEGEHTASIYLRYLVSEDLTACSSPDFGDSDEPLQLHNVSSSVLKKVRNSGTTGVGVL